MKIYAGAPAAARNYVEAGRARADDYYLAEGTGIARRYTATGGRVAELASLTGDSYEAWVAGRDPDTGEPRGRLRPDGRAVRFVEVVVNGPKSWSLAAALHPDVAAAYNAAQDRAAEQILGWLSQHATTRVGPRGGQVPVPAQVLEAVTVRHYTSRAGDPHRHLHLQINARVFAAGKWRGLHTVCVRDSLDAVNGIGHAAMACDPQFQAALSAHGYQLDVHGEIRQLPDFVGPFSSRSAQVARNLDRYEREWTAAHPDERPGPALRRAWDRRAWASGRPDKIRPRPGVDLQERWRTELAALGYRDRDRPVNLPSTRVGRLDRDSVADRVLGRLAAGRSAWNAADIRGGVEQWIATARVVAGPAVRAELAEDLTARALARCVPLLDRHDVPEHIRAWTSPGVVAVEADLTARLASRASIRPSARDLQLSCWEPPAALHPGQAAAVAALAGERPLLVVEGAAGAGKTTTLAAARQLLERRGSRLLVVTPTLKAAKVASGEVGAPAGSAAWLAHQHGWRWTGEGGWTRLRIGEADAVTGAPYPGPAAEAWLRTGDLLVIDEAGMLDQDTARALLSIADECRARVALLGDRHQLPAVGRGGVLDLAARAVDPAGQLTLTAVHRFTRTDAAGITTPDREYARLTLAMRTGHHPGAVFDALLARGQIRTYPDATALCDAVAAEASGSFAEGRRIAVVVETREQATDLNAAIRDRLVAADCVDDTRVVTTGLGERIGAGDRIATRRNDHELQIANRDTWVVTDVRGDGALNVRPDVTPPGARPRTLPPHYVTEHVELAYATTAHGAQGDTTTAAHLVVGVRTGAAAAYVGMTRGREANTAHLVAADVAGAREQWVTVFGRDRADLGPAHAARLAAIEMSRYAEGRPLDQVLAELHQAWTAEPNCLERLDGHQLQRYVLAQTLQKRAEEGRRLAGLEARCHQAADAAERARQRAAASVAAVAADTGRIRQALLTRRDADRPAAYAAAQVVLEGPGRLRPRRGQVTRAGEQLADWADRWRAHLPALPTDTNALAVLAGRPDDRPVLQAALATAARRAAKAAHPEHAALTVAVTGAVRDHADARRELEQARAWYDDRPTDPESQADLSRQLADTAGRLAASREQLAHIRARIAVLAAEPALRAQPADLLSQERTSWATARQVEEAARRSSTPSPRRSAALVVRPPEPPTRLTHRQTPVGPRYGR